MRVLPSLGGGSSIRDAFAREALGARVFMFDFFFICSGIEMLLLSRRDMRLSRLSMRPIMVSLGETISERAAPEYPKKTHPKTLFSIMIALSWSRR